MSKPKKYIFLIDISDIISRFKLNKKTKLSPINNEYIFYRAMIRLVYENTIRNHILENKNKDMIAKQIISNYSLGIVKLESLIYIAFRELETHKSIDLSFTEDTEDNMIMLDVEYVFKNKMLITITDKTKVN